MIKLIDNYLKKKIVVFSSFLLRKPHKTNIQHPIALQIREGKKPNPIDEIFGKWPGNETDEEFEKMLLELKNDN